MPPEVLSNIFRLGKSLCEDELEDEGVEYGQLCPSFELLVTHICPRFRRIAINARALWSAIRIGPGESLTKIATYLERSGQCMLDVHVNLPRTSALDERTRLMVQLILCHSFRWRTFYYKSDNEIQESPMLSYLADIAAPVLEELSLSIDELRNTSSGIVSDNDNFRMSIFRKGAPKLSFVRLRGFAIYTLMPPLVSVQILHLDQTKSLALRYPMFRQIVSTSMVLEHLSVYGDMVTDGVWPGERGTIYFPKLRSLRICDIGGRAYAAVLLCFNAPLLEALALKGVQGHDLDRLWSIGNTSRFPKLRCLTFWDFDLLLCDWNHAFRVFSGISVFSSYSSVNKSTVLRLLSESDADAMPWPNLKSLSFVTNIEDKEETLSIQKFINARRLCGHPLDVIRLGISEEDGLLQNRYSQASTRIEFFQNLDKWPPNRDFRDWDDDLFL
ncbi:hypothetical protein AX17_005739 [Amanita inopinata Kibby_2008]|nr:hypothetical protein AX17_005739 [Amanita inopinata Kibby_2008]